MKKLRVLDLFSGIGGFSLGLERTGGFETVAFCEIEPFCQRVLKKHWPEVPIYENVTTADFGPLGPVDLVTAGFPCQDISFAGPGAGLSGARSGLFWHVLRAVRLVGQPRLLLENVAALLDRGMGVVLGALAQIGHDAEWHCISASGVGAPHRRDRVWVVAHPSRIGQPRSGQYLKSISKAPDEYREADRLVDAFQGGALPFVCRGHDGGSDGMDRLKSLGNSVVPQIPEIIGRAILEAAE